MNVSVAPGSKSITEMFTGFPPPPNVAELVLSTFIVIPWKIKKVSSDDPFTTFNIGPAGPAGSVEPGGPPIPSLLPPERLIVELSTVIVKSLAT